jgi:PAS domain S-box-containing protein
VEGEGSASALVSGDDQDSLTIGQILDLFAGTGAAVTAVDSRQRIAAWNSAAEGMLGFSASEVVGTGCIGLMNGCDREDQQVCRRDCTVIEQVKQREPVARYEMLCRSRHGEPLWVNISIVRVEPIDVSSPVAIHVIQPAGTSSNEGSAAAEEPLRVGALIANEQESKPVLTPREREVLRLLAAGKGVREIAAKLVISAATVRNHIANILSKLGVHTRLQAVVHASTHGLL